jgi:4-amino-4-deoxy-L-arabinose transferase-like glycosyltransferase
MSSTAARSFAKAHWSLFLLLLIAAIWLYRSPYSASDLEIPPDTVEYALAPLELLESGYYQITVEGRPLPPRYPPWFPVILILPSYLLFGHDPGNAILPVTAIAVVGVGFAWMIGRRASGTTGAILAALFLLFLPSYTTWAKQVMTDVPSTALMLATCLVYLKVRQRPQSPGLHCSAGVLIALTMLFRPIFAAMLLPFVIAVLSEKRCLLLRLFALVLPMLAALAAVACYNAATFNSPLRNGYHFWAAVPHDYASMMFSGSNVKMNLEVIIQTAFPVLLLACLAAAVVIRLRRPDTPDASHSTLNDLLTFLGPTLPSILLFHLFYFFPSDRFFLPLLAGAAIVLGSLLGRIIEQRLIPVFAFLVPTILLVVLAGRLAVAEPLPHRRLAAERVRKFTPENAMVISAIDPVYLERLGGRGSTRRIVPISREVEYASKVLVPKRIRDPHPRPSHWRDGRAIALRQAGAQEAVQFVASEKLDFLASEVANGKPVFLDTTFIAGPEAKVAAQMRQRFSFVPRAAFLYQLQPLQTARRQVLDARTAP